MHVLESIWLFFQDQILGMQWLSDLLGWGLSAVGLDISGRIGGSIRFFIFMYFSYVLMFYSGIWAACVAASSSCPARLGCGSTEKFVPAFTRSASLFSKAV